MGDILHYFIDEAGDDTLFANGGSSAIGQNGVSSFFMLGKLEINNPPVLRGKLEALRQSLLADPYFSGIPSFAPKAGKTAFGFHAKDDLPEVRYEVLKLLRAEGENLRFYAVVKDKQALTREVAVRQIREPGYIYRKKSLYDDLVRQLFNKFHRIADTLDITFSERGSSDRTRAFEKAVNVAGRDFKERYACHCHHGPSAAPRHGTTPVCRRWIVSCGCCKDFLKSAKTAFCLCCGLNLAK